MANFMKDFREKYPHRITQILLTIACTALIVYCMPREKFTTIHFEMNEPWNQEQLIAEFDFKVNKSDAQMAAEQDSLTRVAKSYFKYESEIAEEMTSKFNSALIKELAGDYYTIGINCYNKLKEIYKKGIVSDNDALILKSKEKKWVECNRDGNIRTKDASDFTGVSNAIKLISETDATNTITPEFVETYIKPNYIYDSSRSAGELNKSLALVDSVMTTILKGQRIINKGDIINSTTHRIISTYIAEVQKQEAAKATSNSANMFFGQMLFAILGMFILLFYIYTYHRDIAEKQNKFNFTLLAATVFPALTGILASYGTDVYILPYAMVPAMLCLFLNSHIALIVHTISIMICSMALGAQYEFLILQFTAGICTILSLKDLSSRAQMFRCVFFTLLAYSAIYLCYILVTYADISKLQPSMYASFVASAMLMMLVYPLMYLIEKAFGFVSSVTLIELSNFNNKLLQKMSQETPGTFQHSIQVGNLAAEAAAAIGANSLEVRTGALYHDIGKTENPIYFTENQSGGISPHKSLTPIESAKIIIDHVRNGLVIAKREGLPRKIQEFISTHHGLSKAGYFYITYKNEHPDEIIDESLFTYPGPMPSTAEQAILSMADCVEAASHSLEEYTEKNINELVDKMVDPRVKNGDYSLSPLTFQDISIIKRVFKKRLMAIYHTRISYPSEKKKEENK